ncbi:DnaB-like helicase C-terminal domain-containing protein [Photorhabdus kayaii]|uniref:DnaB-like helicase C-terminal domain-containing protein n=1 Tax=Photorhabdus kayaii TaxID=230088 RepID=UPI0021D49B9A|nr:DnaB-like helicase C-terminal domain-containing protein [Photorhabdus kayaii]MCT8353855.1 helicase [Photorhabdus kayaii]
MTDLDLPVMPHNIEAEQSVLGSLLIDSQSDNSQRVFSKLKPELFYSRPHQTIFEHMLDMNRRKQTVDLITVSDSLESHSALSHVGGFAYLAELSRNTPSVANIVGYAKVVHERAIERFAIRKANQISELFYSRNGMTAVEKLEAAQALITEAADHAKIGVKRGLVRIDDVICDWFSGVEARFNNPELHAGLKTGIRDLDEMLAPKYLVNGALFVVGARPKMGKTTVLSEIAKNVAVELPVALFSMEMTNEQIVERMVSQKSNVNTDTLYGGTDSDTDWNLIGMAMLELKENPNIWVDDTPAMSLAHIQSECRKLKRKVGRIGFIGVDYLTLMKAEKADRNDLAYGNITKGLKNLAKELNTVVVLLTQLNRNLEDRANKRPMPSDSRDTGQIEQDCDYWMGIYRDSVYHDNADKTLTELILRSNRHGKTGTVYVEQKGLCLFPIDQIEGERRANRNEEKFRKPYRKDF